jgi:hypothetical protein
MNPPTVPEDPCDALDAGANGLGEALSRDFVGLPAVSATKSAVPSLWRRWLLATTTADENSERLVAVVPRNASAQ